uniref:Saposin B-type domain-containing protein n=1 Tax=Strongyloides stercoralis TaxID=6248 RepID=A0A913IBH7_STRER
MKFLQILILSIFLLYSRYSYSLKCYQGVNSKILTAQAGEQETVECNKSFCLSLVLTLTDKIKDFISLCDVENKCKKVGTLKEVLTIKDYSEHMKTSVENIPEENRNTKIHSSITCCNTDNCNSIENSDFSSVSAGGNNKQLPSSPSGNESNKKKNSGSESESSNSSGSLFCFHSFIKLFGALFISNLYKL